MCKSLLLLTVAVFVTVTVMTAKADETGARDNGNRNDQNLSFWDDLTKLDMADPAYVPSPDQIEVPIKYNNLDPNRGFFEQLAARVRKEAFLEGFVAEDNYVGRIDLNGDGRDELIVHFFSTYFCGTHPDCEVSVYHNDGSQWHYIGEALSYRGQIAQFDKRKHNGWNVIKTSDWTKCWVTPEEIRAYYKKINKTFDDYGPIKMSDNGIGQKIDPNFGGYLFLPGQEPCYEE